MTVCDWSKVSRETLESCVSVVSACHAHGFQAEQVRDVNEWLGKARAEALVPPLRTRAEVDAEIAGRLRSARITNRGSNDRLFIEGLDAVAFIGLCAEPVAIQTAAEILDGEFPEVAEACSREESGPCPPLRTRAKVDGEIAEMVREYIRDVGARDAFGSMERGRQKLIALVAEPTAPEIDPLHPTGRCTCGGEERCDWCKSIIDCEFPEADPCSCEEALGLREKLRVTTGLLTAIELDIHHALAGLK